MWPCRLRPCRPAEQLRGRPRLIPIELGGAPADIANFWDEPTSLKLADGTQAASGQKDALESALKMSVCAGKTALVDAQRQIATDWLGEWTALGRPGAAAAPSSSSTAPPTGRPTTTVPAATTSTTIARPTTTSPAVAQKGITAGAFCSLDGAIGYNKAGVMYTCTTSATDDRDRWRQ